MSMVLRAGSSDLHERRPLSLAQILKQAAERCAQDNDDYLEWLEEREAAGARAKKAAAYTESALARTFAERRRDVSLIGIGQLNETHPVWFPDAGDGRSTLVDANRYALGASMVIAYDTEYQSGDDRNVILSYQVCAFEPRGEWCEFIIHVQGGEPRSPTPR